METCGIIAPRQEHIVGYRYDHYLAECILPRAHYCEHVVKTPEGRYFAWSYDYGCDCCEPDEPDRCTLIGELSEEEFRELLVENELVIPPSTSAQ